jgi:arylsulfatase A
MKSVLKLPGIVLLIGLFGAPVTSAGDGPMTAKPNIVLILADDMGYGDVRAYNPASKIPTPHLDQLAAEGMRFTDLHAGASWCQPSRYALLTGRYAWRDGVGKGMPKRPKGHVIDAEIPTLASLLRERGYRTSCIGKWHLGLGERGKSSEMKQGVRVPMGPAEVGFDESYILPGSLDFGPYVFLKNQVPVATPDKRIPGRDWPAKRHAMGEFWRAGKAMPGFDHRGVLPHLRDRAVSFIRRQTNAQPFFLFFPLTAPHTPWLPTKEFKGRSGAGMYGDFVTQVDDVAGDIVAALEQNRLTRNTLILFTSDNGAYWVSSEEKEFGHEANGILRGGKNDAWEGGHRMPFIARWPAKVPAGTSSPALLCFTDLTATLATLAGRPLSPDHHAVDSRDASAVLLGQVTEPYAIRSTLALVSGQKIWFRNRDWKAIPFLGSGGNSEPKKRRSLKGEPRGQLYNLREDVGETRNRYLTDPNVLEALKRRWKSISPNAPLGGI